MLERKKIEIFKIEKVDASLMTYRHHNAGYTRSLHRVSLLKIRVTHFEETVLKGRTSVPLSMLTPDPTMSWDTFSIWGSGRDARKFYMTLSVSLYSHIHFLSSLFTFHLSFNSPSLSLPSQYTIPAPQLFFYLSIQHNFLSLSLSLLSLLPPLSLSTAAVSGESERVLWRRSKESGDALC